jgi:predicted dehydrogenase/threonine dehydrogenase-like Zn-dependent dehydrogenase
LKQVQQNYRTGALRIVDVPAPRVSDGNLLVATRASLISSGTERHLIEMARASLAGKAMARPDLVRRVVQHARREGLRPTLRKVLARLDTPIPLGYSIAGEVIEVGRRCPGFAAGDRVACAGAGIANHAEINSVPRNLAVRIPDGVDDEAASFVSLGTIALQGVRLAAPTLGERIVVMGLGLIGLLTVQLLKANGCRVLGFDPHAHRADHASALGADLAVHEGLEEAVAAFTGGVGADAVIIAAASSSSDAINTAAAISRMKGRIVVVGMVGMAIDREPFYRREIELKMSMSYGPGRHDPAYEQDGHDYPLPYVRWTGQRNMEAFLGLVAEGKVTPRQLVTHRYAIADAEHAYRLLQSDTPHMGVVLSYPSEAGTSGVCDTAPVASATKSGVGRVAFIGFGTYAREVLLPAVRKTGNPPLATVVTATGLSAAHAAEKFGFSRSATDPAAVLEDPDIDTVFIATRHDTHASLTAAALRAGKNVFCEKPLALDAEGLSEVIAAAREARGLLTVGFNRRFAPLLGKAKEALAPRMGPLVMLYRVSAGPVPQESWIQRPEGGGRILGEVCHFVDALTFLAGSLPIEAHAIAARGLADAVSILIRFADGSTGTIVYSSLGDPRLPKEHLEVFAEGRTIQLHDFRRLDTTARGRTRTTKAAQDKGQAALVAEFLTAVRSGSVAPIPPDELFAVTETTFAMEESLRTGAPVVIGRGD